MTSGIQQNLMGTGMEKGMQFGAGGLTSKQPTDAFKRQEAYGYINPGYGMQGKQVFKYGRMASSARNNLRKEDKMRRSMGLPPIPKAERDQAKFAWRRSLTNPSVSRQDRLDIASGANSRLFPGVQKSVADDYKIAEMRRVVGGGSTRSAPKNRKAVVGTRAPITVSRQSVKSGMSGTGRMVSQHFNALGNRGKIAFGVAGGVAGLVGAGITLNSIKGSKDHPMSSGIGMGIGAAGIAAGLKVGGGLLGNHYKDAMRSMKKSGLTKTPAFGRAVAGAKLANTFKNMKWGKVGGIGMLAGGAIAGLGLARRSSNR